VPVLERCLRECRLAFLHAPNLHPAMKYAAPVRKQLGIRTIFNLLGPLTNPAGARRQVLGTARPELVELLAQTLLARHVRHAWVVCGHGGDGRGLCDLTITGLTQVAEVRDGVLSAFTVHPSDVGLGEAPLETLIVDSPKASAAVIRAILDGEDLGPRRHHALLNAGAALVVAGVVGDLADGVARAGEAVDTGAASRRLEQVIEVSNASA
jgi:anthranilate phosphoribosyltransferase